jgi:hypothetical protein
MERKRRKIEIHLVPATGSHIVSRLDKTVRNRYLHRDHLGTQSANRLRSGVAAERVLQCSVLYQPASCGL